MPSLGLVVNSLALVCVSCFSVWSLQRRIRLIVGRRRRPRGLPSLAASPTPNLATTFTTRRTPRAVDSSSSFMARGLVPVDTATLLRQAEQSRRGALTSCGDATEAPGESGALRVDAALREVRPWPNWSS